jgi:5-methylcytosine-specific restriction endonuclease McrA
MKGGISQNMRRRVMDRDGRRCVVCFIGRGEPYPGEPGSTAILTIGHRVPEHRDSGVRSLDELQTECSRCNETVRDELQDPVTLPEVMPDLKRLNRVERGELLKWVFAGHRLRSRLDEVYDRVRMLTPDEQRTFTDELRSMLGRSR